MSSRTAVPVVPLRVVPKATRSDADDAIYLASSYGLTPDEWQADVVRAWMGLRRDGKWTASTCLLAVARQNGKNAVLEIRELFGMIVLGEKILHTAHEVKTARKAFLRLASFFENPRRYPELAALVKEIRKTNGQEAIVLNNGGAVEFIARSKGSGRGFTADVLVCDEAQDLSDESWAALLPTISAAPLGNPQRIITGTPPSGTMNGEVLLRTRRSAIAGKNPRLCLIDYGCEGPLPDVDDRDEWKRRNPATQSGRLHMSTIEDERSTMDSETFARERFCWWGDPAVAAGLIFPTWPQLVGDPVQPTSYAIAADINQTRFVLGGAHGEFVDILTPAAFDGPQIPAAQRALFVAEVARVAGTTPVGIQEKGPAWTLAPDLEAAGVHVEPVTMDGFVQACADFEATVIAGTLRHGTQPELDAAIRSAAWRTVGDRRVISRKNADIPELEAVVIARHMEAEASNYDVADSIY